MTKRVYLAGPTVFALDAAERGARLKALCAERGLEGLFPGDIDLGDRPTVSIVHKACMDMLKECDAVVADLSAWRGPHVDDGTAFELGVAWALEKPIFGYTDDMRPLVEKIWQRLVWSEENRDPNGNLVEDFGAPVNAMLAGAVESISATPEEAIAAAAARV